jgi:hypothetical protein
MVTVAASGERKSAVDTEALWPIRKREADLRVEHEAKLLDYLNDKEAWDVARDHKVKACKGDRVCIKSELGALGSPPQAPLTPLLTCPEPTFEGLCKLLAAGCPSIGIFAAEGGQFTGGHGMTEEAKLRTAAGFSAVWDGEPIRRVRGGDGVLVLPGRRAAMHLMAQPDVAMVWLSDPILRDQGLLSRVLAAAPEPASGTRLWREPSPDSEAAMKRYGARLLDILECPLPLADGTANELTPRKLALDPEARRMWIGFANHVERAIAPSGEFEAIRGLANKLAEHAARIAGVLTMVRDPDTGTVKASDLEAGIELAQFYAGEALRLDGASRANGELLEAQKLLDWLLASQEPAVSVRFVCQYGPNSIRTSERAEELIGLLVKHGWLVLAPKGTVMNGQRCGKAWLIVRE